MRNYGSKDIMRMESIKQKARGDYMNQVMYAYNMACAITEPGKAMARGYAAQEVFGDQSVIGQVFFERAFDLSGGRDVRPVASVNPLDTSEEGIEAEYENIPMHEQPASRRDFKLETTNARHKTPFSRIVALGKINVHKGSGPQFNLRDHPVGTMEMWRTEEGRYRMIYTTHYDPIYKIGDLRTFRYDDKDVGWEMVDYIEAENVANFAPLYGKSINIYTYD